MHTSTVRVRVRTIAQLYKLQANRCPDLLRKSNAKLEHEEIRLLPATQKCCQSAGIDLKQPASTIPHMVDDCAERLGEKSVYRASARKSDR